MMLFLLFVLINVLIVIVNIVVFALNLKLYTEFSKATIFQKKKEVV